MAAIWFILDGEQRRGPFTSDELVKVLHENPHPRNVPIWREGLPGWQTAWSVPEIRETLPPLPSSAKGVDISILALAAILAAIIGGIGSVLVVDRNPSLNIDEVFLTSWMTLLFILTALFIVIRGVRTSAPAQWGKLSARFLLFGFLVAAGGVVLSLADFWVFVPLVLLAFGLIARLRKRKRQDPREQPQP